MENREPEVPGDPYMIHRRAFLFGLVSALAAPAIVRVQNIMPVRLFDPDPWISFQSWPYGQEAPSPCVSGYDFLSRARKICTLTGGHLIIRNDPAGPQIKVARPQIERNQT